MSKYRSFQDGLIFPNGMSVRESKKNARELSKKNLVKRSVALAIIAGRNFGSKNQIPWERAIKKLLKLRIEKNRSNSKEITEKELDIISSENPRLTQFGVDGYNPLYLDVIAKEKPEIKTDQLRKELISSEHNVLFHPSCLREINLALEFVTKLRPGFTLNSETNSYELKHMAERYLNKKYAEGCYISHGSLIIAALYQGFLPERCNRNSFSLYFNIDESSVWEIANVSA
ncbi:hypothetical protein [Endozoicomonas euniceicola]|uniref:Uncharacterized protein n=1 Tax=Endozoicomonas euniceicola TaxID=1234143 RepID=A0ABY6GU53_9GAMM|nr:hypothetical protein [Endozoicomonas euniceicola]UYM16315.1 hypothetical protein NX720_26565 [Endozoicomonas euniceicola]